VVMAGCGRLHPPRGERRFRCGRVRLEPVDRRTLHPGRLGDLGDARCPLTEHVANRGELRSRERRLAAEIRRFLTALGVLDSRPLAGLMGTPTQVILPLLLALSANGYATPGGHWFHNDGTQVPRGGTVEDRAALQECNGEVAKAQMGATAPLQSVASAREKGYYWQPAAQ
jgi:hypothetical protein